LNDLTYTSQLACPTGTGGQLELVPMKKDIEQNLKRKKYLYLKLPECVENFLFLIQ
jgi:hypothetical protein